MGFVEDQPVRTPDPITQTMFALPLYVLYEIAILASSRVERRRAERNA